ncbi:chemotaxis protein methyltransferase [Pilimelia terevasa]|uniref:protein-glutamate O-methyltransferase n=1 Tax=Pilimelia terevasa TaxID=53372 RepID=A0A8J3FI96_9ACTN|nr:protein-glutamate O-methyltransferase CheR [Pilimelia terevasa]GGK17960.1 chemotaxis protein methyltransferase [Pilimelia terevasa]
MTAAVIPAAEFAYLAELLRRESSIVLGADKEYLVQARLLPLARKVGAGNVGELLTQVRLRSDRATIQSIVDAMTTNETSWFRDNEPFAALHSTVLPALLAARSAQRHLRVWSAACSSGQETYSLAITLQEFLPTGWTYEILATDISGDMVARAQTGQYSQIEVNRGLPARMLVHYFTRSGAHWEVAPALRRHVQFQRLNLVAPPPPTAPFDVVFLRNVLIYFDIATKKTVLRHVARLMRPDAWLFLGAAESTIGVDDSFRRTPAGRTFAYQLNLAKPPEKG